MNVPEKHRAVAHAWVDGADVERYGPLADYWLKDDFPTWNEPIEYRLSPKPKIKKWRWVIKDAWGLEISACHYSESDATHSSFIQKIDSTMIEEDEE